MKPIENIFYEDAFFSDIESLFFHFDLIDDDGEDIKALPDDWAIDVIQCNLEPLFLFNAETLVDAFLSQNEDRQSEDGDEWDGIEKIFQDNIDFEKIDKLIPKLYFPTGKEFTITKQDLLDYIAPKTN